MIGTEVIMAIQKGDRLLPLEKLKTSSDGTCSIPLDFIEGDNRLRQQDPRSGYRFYLANDYIKADPKSSVPLKESRRSKTELWLRK